MGRRTGSGGKEGGVNIAVFGLGKLGAPLAAVLASKGHCVHCHDINVDFVQAIEHGESPVDETGLAELITANRQNLIAELDGLAAARGADIVMIIVPTPSDATGKFSAAYAVSACKVIGTAMSAGNGYKLIVLVSTVMPGTMEAKIIPALEKASNKKAGRDFGVCYNPEFIALGSVIHDMLNPDFVLIGESDPVAGGLLEEFYYTLHTSPIVRMSLVDAELAKLCLNCYITTKISYANMLGELCEHTPGADANVVTAAIGLDRRVGRRYLKPATAYGGPCFPRDNRALRYHAQSVGVDLAIPEATETINKRQTPRLAEIVASHTRAGERVAVLGIAYKPDTSVVEESAAVALLQYLTDRGYYCSYYDPQHRGTVPGAPRADSLATCLRNADTAVIMTAWPEFIHLPPPETDGVTIIDPWGLVDATMLPATATYVRPGLGS